MKTIDLNADLGELEDGALDAAVMPYISSCNIACGAHAGNPETMRRTIRLAVAHGVAIGAHPGYPDAGNFGRVSMTFQTLELCELIKEQILLLKEMAEEEGAEVRHVKLHGALYNDLAFDYPRSLAVAKTIAEIDPELRFIVFSNSETARAAEDAGLVAIHEVFADRAYTEDGRLRPRSEPGAVLHAEDDCLKQAARFVSGAAGLPADSICVHGDNPSAVQFVSRLRNFFAQQNISVQPFPGMVFRCYPLGDRSLLAKLPPRICKSTHCRIRALQLALAGSVGITEMVPCYAELKIDFDPSRISFDELRGHIESLDLRAAELPAPRRIEVPVVYDGEDLKRVAAQNGLTENDVIRLHCEASYSVYMLGFSPGFAYLGGLHPKLATPRLETPRVSVPAGAVGIAGNQTGVYPVASPGGWNIIGRTDLKLFDPHAERPFLFEAGDEVRFVPVGRARSPSEPRTARRSVPASRYIKVIDAGLYTTVQDAGRPGYLQYGLPPGGAMDRKAFETANAVLGNDAHAAVLECTGTMPVLQFSDATTAAVVYADRFQTLEITAGETVKFQPLEKGYRAYIAVAGGFDVPMVMGSRATYVPGQLGGFEGRVLKAGDVLPVGNVDGASCSVTGEVLPVANVDGASCSVTGEVQPVTNVDGASCSVTGEVQPR
ncbi:5-oxoprolinase subunit PxpB, partial [Pontiella sp.]|uniref:5-oxoprolinase subunit PxpB n=1 Tax=Pontiella sp. TaxID=2837462 RepID=UPI00356A4D73